MVLAIDNLTLERGARTLLEGLDLTAGIGDIVGIGGANGIGKTTLCRAIAQLHRPLAGTVQVDGIDTAGPDAARARLLVGYGPHRPLGWDALSVRRNLELAMRGHPDPAGHATAAIDRWGLDAYAARPISHLSRGWQQRYGLARIDHPGIRLRVLDEPTTGLDTAGRTQLTAAVRRWAASSALVVTSHDHDWLAEVATVRFELSGSLA